MSWGVTDNIDKTSLRQTKTHQQSITTLATWITAKMTEKILFYYFGCIF